MKENNTKEQAVRIYEDNRVASVYVARRIADLIKAKQDAGAQAVIGLATGATPKGVYQELVRMHQLEGLSFANVVTFNLDEYYPMHPVEERSYVTFMNEQLFKHIDIRKEHIHIPDGTLSMEAIQAYCAQYEQRIVDFGGLDLQLLGIGSTGHIGFNEPGSLFDSSTRLVDLDALTRSDAINDFGGEEFVPRQAITMGIKTIREAREIILMALSARKANIIQRTLEGEITEAVPATLLRHLSHVEYVLDKEAAAGLQRVNGLVL